MIGTIVIPLIFIGAAVKDGGAVLCDSTEGCIGIDTSRLLGIFASFYVTAWIPSLSTLVVVMIWFCAFFNTGSDARLTLNRRIIATPLIMAVIVTLTSIATFAAYRVADVIFLPVLSSNSFSRNWLMSIRFIVVLLNEISAVYPTPVLFYFYTQSCGNHGR